MHVEPKIEFYVGAKPTTKDQWLSRISQSQNLDLTPPFSMNQLSIK